MAARFIPLLFMPWNICLILQICSLQGIVCDVPDDVVYTDQHRNLRFGDSVALTCQFRGTPLAVYWRKLDDPTRVTTLVSWLKGDPVTGLCVGERPCEIMEMNEDYSLIIKKVSIAEQGRYICRVANYKGILIQNVTEIRVFSPPKKPYPVINECLMSPDMKSKQTCVISTAEDPINISCTVSGYFPDIDLFFLSGSRYITTIHSEEMTNGDGKKKRSITIQASPRPEQYFCVASDIPGVGGRREASLLLVTTATTPVNRADSTLAEKIVAPLIVTIVLVAVNILIAISRRRIRQQEMPRRCTVESPAENNVEDDEMTPMYQGSEEEHLKVTTSPTNQTSRLSLALEEAGKAVDGRNRPVYNQVAKTFFQIRDEYNSDLTHGILEEFAPNISDRRCQRLWNTLELPENAARNEDEVSMTNARVLYPSVDNNKPRRRMRHTAERYNRHDVADVLISRDRRNIMSLMWPDLLAFEGDKQCLLKSVSNGNVFTPRDQRNISSIMGSDLLAFEGHERCLQKSVFNGSYSRVGSPNRYGSQTCGMSTQPTSGPIQILIARGDRKTLTMMVRPTDTVSHLKVKIRERLNIASFQYWLQFQGKILSDMSTLQSYGLQDSSTVHLHGRLRGGSSFSHNLS